MKLYTSFKRIPTGDTGEQIIEVTQRYCSNDKQAIDVLEQWMKQKYRSNDPVEVCPPNVAAQKQKAGIAAAKERGLKFGRPSYDLPDNFEDVRAQWLDKRLTLAQAAELCHMPKSTFAYKVKHFVPVEPKRKTIPVTLNISKVSKYKSDFSDLE